MLDLPIEPEYTSDDYSMLRNQDLGSFCYERLIKTYKEEQSSNLSGLYMIKRKKNDYVPLPTKSNTAAHQLKKTTRNLNGIYYRI